MLKIRLTRVGKKNDPAYRIVVAESKFGVKRKFIEILGNYNPTTNPKTIVIKKDKVLVWLEKGAKPSDTVNNLLFSEGIVKTRVNKVYAKKKEEEKTEAKETVEDESNKASNDDVKDEVAEETTVVTEENVKAEETKEESAPVEETSNEPKKTEE